MSSSEQVSEFYSLLRYPGPNALITYLWANRIRPHIPKQDFVFLDAGCGSGRHSAGLLDLYPQARGYCLDFSAPSLREAKALAETKGFANRATYIHASYLEPIPLPEQVDIALAIGTIHHSPDPLLALRNIAATVKPGGHVACMVYGTRGHTRRYEVKEAVHLVTDSKNTALSLYKSYQDHYEGILDKSLRQLSRELRNKIGQKVKHLLGRKTHGYCTHLNNDVFRADAILNPIDTAFGTDGVKALVEGAGLEPVAMLGLGRPDKNLLPAGWIEGWSKLPYWDRVRVMELLDPLPASWSFICRKPA